MTGTKYPALPSSHLINSVSQQEAWDGRYREKGRQWGNAPVEQFQIPYAGIILELGVGDGKNIRARGKTGVFCIGLDFSPAALKLCQASPELCDINLLLGEACHLPVRDVSVDQVYAHHILGHLPLLFQPVLMSEIFRILKPGGLCALTVFAVGDMRDGKGQEVEPKTYLRGDGIITRYFTPDEIRGLSSGFTFFSINREAWQLRIRGKDYSRAVLTVVLEKPHSS